MVQNYAVLAVVSQEIYLPRYVAAAALEQLPSELESLYWKVQGWQYASSEPFLALVEVL